MSYRPPQWCNGPYVYYGAKPTITEWERELRRLGVSERAVLDGKASRSAVCKLQDWVRSNKGDKFVPEEFLLAIGEEMQ